MAKTSPTQRTVAECKRRGWLVQNVEQTIRIPGGRTFKRDLFGGIDLVAIDDAGERPLLIGIQTTSGAHHADRRAKLLALEPLKRWVMTGAELHVWTWAKQGPRGKRKTWTLRIEPITVDMFADTVRREQE